MDNSRRSGISLPGWVGIIMAFVIGFAIGLVVFGWWLTPVIWEEGSFEVLSPTLQQEFLRASIDSYAFRPDDVLATTRYNALGEQKGAVLAAIASDPRNLNPQDVERFAAVVGAADILTNPPISTSPEEPSADAPKGIISNPLILGAGLCLAVSIIGIISIVLILAASRRSGRSRPGDASEIYGSTTDAEGKILTPDLLVSDSAGAREAANLDWVGSSGSQDPYQTLRIEEGQATGSFEDASLGEPGATPPRGLDLGTFEPPAESVSDEDEIGADLSEVDYSALAGSLEDEIAESPLATAFIDEPTSADAEATLEKQAFDLPEDDDFSWLDSPSTDAGDNLDWLTAPPLNQAEEALEQAERTENDAFAWAGDEAGEAAEAAGSLTEIDLEDVTEDAFAKFGRDIADLDGIDAEYAVQLRSAGIAAPLLLLRKGATVEGRGMIAQNAGISEELVLHWTHYVDLQRVQGIDHTFAALLQAVGIETIEILAQSDPDPLYERLRAGAELAGHPRQIPSTRLIRSWIDQARQLPKTIME